MIGYARVSTREQDPAAQEWELSAAGADRVFVDHGESSRVADRPQWVACKDYLRVGDTLVVRSLDRLAGRRPWRFRRSPSWERGITSSLTEPDIVIPVVRRRRTVGHEVARTRIQTLTLGSRLQVFVMAGLGLAGLVLCRSASGPVAPLCGLGFAVASRRIGHDEQGGSLGIRTASRFPRVRDGGRDQEDDDARLPRGSAG